MTVNGDPVAMDVAYDDYLLEASWSLYHNLCCGCRFWLTCSRQAGRYITTCAVVAASGLNEVADLGICRRSRSASFLATSTSL
jgi:hypothetical protein